MENNNMENMAMENDSPSISLKDLFRIALKYKFMILGVTLACTLIAFLYVMIFATPTYRSTACVVVTISKVSGSEGNETVTYDYSNSQKIVETIAKLTSKDIVVNKVVETLNPSSKATDEVKAASKAYIDKLKEEVIASLDDGETFTDFDFSFVTAAYLKENLSVSSSTSEFLIDIHLVSENRREASYVLDCVIEKLIETCNSDKLPLLNDTTNQVNDASYASYYKPNKMTTTLIGFAIGLVISVAIIVLIELLRTHFKDSEEVESYLHTTIIGQVYDVEMKKHTRRELAVKSLDVNKTNYNKLISTLDYYSETNKAKVIQVTSSIPSEGKSTIIFNTAREMTVLNKKVLLIDLDINRPVQHRMVGLKRNPGFVEYAMGTENLDGIIHHLEEGFDMICAGAKSVNSLILLNGNKLPKLIEELLALNVYDYILIDTPPVHASADSITIARCVDGLIFVVSEKESKKSLALDAVRQIRSRNIPIIGAIFNNIDMKNKSGGYYYYYKYYSHEGTESGNLAENEEVQDDIEPIDEAVVKETMENLDKVNLDNSFLEDETKEEK